jgi:2-isopropylmalate synthase
VYHFNDMEILCKTGQEPHASLSLTVQGETQMVDASGAGPVDAVFKAIEKIAQSGADLKLYSVNAITAGTEAQADVTVRLESNGHIVNGVGSDIDVVAASAKAYVHALNLLATGKHRSHPQREGV